MLYYESSYSSYTIHSIDSGIALISGRRLASWCKFPCETIARVVYGRNTSTSRPYNGGDGCLRPAACLDTSGLAILWYVASAVFASSLFLPSPHRAALSPPCQRIGEERVGRSSPMTSTTVHPKLRATGYGLVPMVTFYYTPLRKTFAVD